MTNPTTHCLDVDASMEAMNAELAAGVAEIERETNQPAGSVASSTITEVLELRMHIAAEASVRLSDGRTVILPFTFAPHRVHNLVAAEADRAQREVVHVDDGLGEAAERELDAWEAGQDR